MVGCKILLLVLCACLTQEVAGVSVTTTKGVVNGFRADYGTDTTQLHYGSADVFLGIPYAEPPIGLLRFQPPQNKTAWNSSLDATSYNTYSQCPQPPSSLGSLPINSSEDCLYLNVFSPNVSSLLKYPVMVWIHGGSLVTGNTQFFGVQGTVRNLVSRGVVVVALQYRLGLLGFFTTNTPDFPANLGMLDQVMALKWVKQEIGAFGGDASQITIFGESAGAASVSAHTYSPLSKGLFQKAIMESGVALLGLDGISGYKHLSELRANQLCNFTSNQWASGNFALLKQCLQNMSYERFNAVELNNPLGWSFVKDDNFFPGWPRDLAANRTNIPILIGTNRDEWSLWELESLVANATKMSNYTKLYYQQQIGQMTQFYGENQSLIMSLIDKVYVDPILPTPDPVNDTLAWFKLISQIPTDGYFISLTAREVDLWQRINKNPNVFLYEFVYPTSCFRLDFTIPWTPVYHASELFYIWMQDLLWNSGNPLISPADFTIANFLGQTWTDFAKKGNPGWNPVTYDNPYQYMEINVNATMKQSYRETARVFWNEVVPAIVGVYPRDPQSNSGTTTTATTTGPSTTISGSNQGTSTTTSTTPSTTTSGNGKVVINSFIMMVITIMTTLGGSLY